MAAQTADVAACDFDSRESEQLVFLARRRYHLKNDVIEFSVPPVKRLFVAAQVCELDHLHAPFSKRRVFGNLD